MTYLDDIAGDELDISFRLRFEGIEQPITQRPVSGALASLVTVSAGESRLDRRRNIVRPAGFSASLMADDDTLAYFGRRGGVEGALSASISRTATTVQLPPGLYADAQTVYVDRETIVLGDEVDAGLGEFAGCTRGAFNGVASAHPVGAIVSSRPRYWRRRRAWLEAVAHPSGNIGAVLGGVLSESPMISDPRLDLEFIDVMTELNRPICSGWSDTAVTAAVSVTVSGAVTWRLTVADIREVVYRGAGLVNFHAWKIQSVDDESRWHIVGRTAVDINVGNSTIEFPSSASIDGMVPLDVLLDEEVTIRQICVMTGDPSDVALWLMLSDLGDDVNNYNALPGIDPQGTDLTRRRMGAGLPLSAVDVDTWKSAGGPFEAGRFPSSPPVSTRPMTLVLDEPRRLLEVLTDEVLWRLGGYCHADPQGRLSFRRFEGSIPQSALPVLDVDTIGQATISHRDDESEVISRVTFESGWDFNTRNFTRRDGVNFLDSIRTYGEETDAAEFSSRSLVVGGASASALASQPTPQSVLELDADRMASRTRRGVERFSARVPWRLSTLSVGNRLVYTDARMPSGAGARGVTEIQCEVVGEKYDLGGVEKQLLLEVIKRGWLIAPSALVATGTNTTRIILSDSLAIDDATKDFAVGWFVRVYYGTAFTTQHVREIAAIPSSQQINITPALPTVPPNNSVVVLELSGAAGENAYTAGEDDYVFLADDDDVVGDGESYESEAARWQ